MTLITTDDRAGWNDAVRSCGPSDIYHIAEYHQHAQNLGEGTAMLFYYREKRMQAALPFLVRPLDKVPGLEGLGKCDATSVYGYPGMITNVKIDEQGSRDFASRFQMALLAALRSLDVIALFSRLNPLIDSAWLVGDTAEVAVLSDTVAIDLTRTEEQQVRGMTKGHRYDIRKARRDRVCVQEDMDFERLDDFIAIYHETMSRAGAREYYLFGRSYFTALKELLGDRVRLYIAQRDGKVVAASMFLYWGNIIQYHLSGTPTDSLSYSGAKIILDEVRREGAAKAFSSLHLGGGIGSSEDSLYRFKAGFSKSRHQFKVLKCVVDDDLYATAIEARAAYLERSSLSAVEQGFFPAYRAP